MKNSRGSDLNFPTAVTPPAMPSRISDSEVSDLMELLCDSAGERGYQRHGRGRGACSITSVDRFGKNVGEENGQNERNCSSENIPGSTHSGNSSNASHMQLCTSGSTLTSARSPQRRMYWTGEPSKFCHFCSQKIHTHKGKLVCQRMKMGFCRKIVCEGCVNRNGWDFQYLSSRNEEWLCPHCAGICPRNAQCHIYNRVNSKRRQEKMGSKTE